MIVKWLLTFLLMIKSDSWCICYELSNDISEPETCSLMDSVNKILNITVTITSEIDAVSFAENVPIRREYDFVIVGSGPSGCVLANRLSDANYSVLLLEAGSAENPIITNIPMSAANLQHSEYNWNYATEPQNKACLSMDDKRCNWPHGRGLGGSSIINYMIYTRGNRRDFDRIASAGNPGWNYDNILPYFKKLEKSIVQPIDDTDSFGLNGLLNIEEARFRTPIATAFVEGAQRLNYTQINYNGGDQIGVSYLQSSTKNGWRQTAARAYLSPVKNKRNLDISLRSWATKLLFNSHGDQVKAVRFVRNKREFTVRVRKEVILSAGAFQSPKLLMLSGIGPEEHLNELNIKVIKNLPVGQTLFEHMAVFGPIFIASNLSDGLININDVTQLKPILEIFEGKGPMTSTGIEALLYMKTNNSVSSDPGYPDIEILQSFATVAFDTTQGVREEIRLSQDAYNSMFKPLENRRAFQFLPMLLHPRSKGHLKLKSRNPFHHPLFYANIFNDSRDIDSLLEGIRESIKIAEQPEFQELGVNLYNATVPGCEDTEFNSDEYWRCYIQHLSATLHHQIGTCKMGPRTDESAVVDSTGRVHGMKNLRVADISILPESPSGHTAAFSFVIGEKIADNIRKDWSPKESNIQKLRRVRKSLDWIYQDPEHTTEIRTTLSTTRRPIHPLFTTIKPKSSTSLEVMNVLQSLNMSALHEQSQQFKNSTIGDVGIILWGSLSASKTIDFKSKLAENMNHTKTKEIKPIEKKLRIFKPKPTTAVTPATTSISIEKNSESTTNTIDEIETTAVDTVEMDMTMSTLKTTTISNEDSANLFDRTEAMDNLASIDTTTIQSTTTMSNMSNMEKILATAMTLDEDSIKTYKLKKTQKLDTSKAKFITELEYTAAEQSFHDESSTSNLFDTTMTTGSVIAINDTTMTK